MNNTYMQRMASLTNPMSGKDSEKLTSQDALKHTLSGIRGGLEASGAADNTDIASTMDRSLFNNQEPKRGFEQALHAFLKGVGDGKKKEKALKMGETMKKIEDIGMAALQQAEQARTVKRADEKVAQELGAFLPYLKDAPADKRFDIINNILQTHNAETGGNVQLFSVDAVDPFKTTIIKDGEAVAANLLDLPAFKEYKNQEKMNQYMQWQKQREDWKEELTRSRLENEQNRVAIQQQNADTQAQSVEKSYDPATQYYKAGAEAQAKEGVKVKSKKEEQNREINETLTNLNTLKALLTDHQLKNGRIIPSPVITGGSRWADAMRYFSLQRGGEGYTYSDIFDSIGTKVTSSVRDMSMKYGNMNQKEFENATRGMMSTKKTKEGNLYLINEAEKILKHRKEANNQEISKYKEYGSAKYKNNISAGMVRMKTKKGQNVNVPQLEIQKYLNGGWVINQ